ncbi:MAG: class I SAM-dependent methyltransferase [Pleurocapsa sp.]
MLSFLLSDSTYDSFFKTLVKGVSPSTFKFLNETILFPFRRKYLTRKLSPYLEDNSQVLDLGSSDGKLAASIQKELINRETKVTFVGCDIHVQPETFIPIVQYDGQRLPFEDNSFDCVLIVDVLHHTNNPGQVLQEAKRVSRQNILLKDHYWSNEKDFTRLKYADYIGNNPYGIPLPYNFLTQPEWQNLIEECQLSIVECKTCKLVVDPCKHIIFKLRV